MPQITGKAIIKVDGNQWRTTDGCKLHPGGVEREAKVGGGKVHGFNEKTKAPELDASVYHTKDTDITAINAIKNATVIFESDTGDRYLLRNAWVGSQEALDAENGTIGVKMSAESCERL